MKSGITQTRQDGTFVKKLTEENSDFVWRVKTNDDSKAEDHYFFILEYDKYDVITIENYDGKSWSKTLDTITENDLVSISYFINLMCETLLSQGEKWPQNLNNLLKTVLPLTFEYMTKAFFSPSRCIYFERYSWILKQMGISLNKYVKQSIIEGYATAMINCYEITLVEMLLKENGIKLSEKNRIKYDVAKKELNDSIEIVKKIIAKKQGAAIDYDDFGTPNMFWYSANTPCGTVDIYISSHINFSVTIDLKDKDGKSKNRIDISEKCKELAYLFDFEG